MITNKAIGELADWAHAALQGDSMGADTHLRRFYHVAASLVACQEFQNHWQSHHHTRLDPAHLECVCKFLETIGRIEAWQVEQQAVEPAAA
jgi:hypothetical protein